MEIINQLKSDIRDVKISTILDGNELIQPNLKRLRKGNNRFFNQDYWKFIKEHKGKIITGSCALYAYGLLDRMPKDIDLIVDRNTFNPKKKLSKDRYPGMDSKLNVIGYYHDRGYNIDFFQGSNEKYIEVDGFFFHDLFEIIDKKLEIYPHRERNDHKDIHDIIYILKKFNPDYSLNSY